MEGGVILRTKFTPRLIAGLEGWWDASVPSSVTLNAGNVSSLADLSGNGRDAAQATASRQPAYTNFRNGLRVITFDHANGEFLRGPWELTLTGQTTFVVLSHNNTLSTSRFGRPFTQTTTTDGTPAGAVDNDFGITGHYIPMIRVSNANQICSQRTGADRAIVTVAYATWGVLSAMYSGTTISNSLNDGTPITFSSDALNTTFDTFAIGGGLESNLATAGGFLNGSIGEVISYSRGLSAEERSAVSQYLREKWATP
jgi:hypothetical protein